MRYDIRNMNIWRQDQRAADRDKRGSELRDIKLEELNQRQLEIENDYHERLAAMEEELTNVILSVVDHVFHSQIAGKREIVMHLIEDAISHSNASNEFQIHLCPQDDALQPF